MMSTQYRVEVLEGGEWIGCIREDLLDEHDGDVNALPAAVFATREDAEGFIVTLCGLMHMGGDPNLFRVADV